MVASQGLAGLDPQQVHQMFSSYRQSQDRVLREQLVLAHAPRAASLARRFANRGEPVDDLVQVATIGLLKAIDRFDPARGVQFSTYATVTIVGEIRRHFRDRFWTIRVPRGLLGIERSPHARRGQTVSGARSHGGRCGDRARVRRCADPGAEPQVVSLGCGPL